MNDEFVVIRLNSKQYIVKKDKKLTVDRVSDPYTLEVLAHFDGDKFEFGEPILKSKSVRLELLEDLKGDKLEVRRYKSKSRYRKHKGHRQPISVLNVAEIINESGKNEVIFKSN
jgi:large subunit ribosomal protein L21